MGAILEKVALGNVSNYVKMPQNPCLLLIFNQEILMHKFSTQIQNNNAVRPINRTNESMIFHLLETTIHLALQIRETLSVSTVAHYKTSSGILNNFTGNVEERITRIDANKETPVLD